MSEQICRYVVLESHITDGADATVCLVVALCEGENSLRIYAHRPWPTTVTARQREYLDDLSEEWASSPPERLPQIMQKLESLSLGFLRASDVGVATLKKLGSQVSVLFEETRIHDDSTRREPPAGESAEENHG
jgi:hypothetical protein